MPIHDGHRKRARKQYVEVGLDNILDHQLLEYLLFYVNPRSDVNPIAHRLLATFGSFSGVFDASPEELEAVPGVGGRTAELFGVLNHVYKRYAISKQKLGNALRTPNETGEFVVPLFYGEREEVLYILLLNHDRRLMNCRVLGRGDMQNVHFSAKKAIEMALAESASSVVLAHNHTSGTARPSNYDITCTRSLIDNFNALGIELADHIIVARTDFVSMAQDAETRSLF